MTVMERQRWTDERLDKAFDRDDADIREIRVEIKGGFERVEKRFERIDDKFDAVLAEMNARFESMQAEMNARFEAVQSEMNTRFDSLQRTMFIGFVTLFASILASALGAMFAA